MKKPALNPHRYDFVWLVQNQNYFLTGSFWLHHEYKKRDFLIISQNNQTKTYVGKQEKKKLEKYGLSFITRQYPAYHRETSVAIAKASTKIKAIKKLNVKRLSDEKYLKIFHAFVNIFEDLWARYFFTEYFLYGNIEKKLQTKTTSPSQNKLLQSRVAGIQNFKFRFRRLLNESWYRYKLTDRYLKEAEKRLRNKCLSYFSLREITDFFHHKNLNLAPRKNYVLTKKNNWRPIIGQSAESIAKHFDQHFLKHPKNNILKGIAASPGRYQGKVKIIPFDLNIDMTKYIKKMNRGDVLVTGSTGPEMILACKKAGAIVTEEGGIISHAAIVSRELSIPCVIGTKIATKVLKDGDKIEVDGAKGLIKLL